MRFGRTLLSISQAAKAAVNRPDGKPAPDLPAPAPPPLRDWPEIQSRHPNWWQVARLEVRQGIPHQVLIAEVRTEDLAFRVVQAQASCCRITKWGDKRPPYVSHRPPLVIGPDDADDNQDR